MLRRIDVAASHRVIVDVCYLLPERIMIIHALGVIALLPHLVGARGLALATIVRKLIQHPGTSRTLAKANDFARGVALETLHDTVESRGLGHQMHVILHNHIGIDAQTEVRPAVCERVGDDAAGFLAIEDGDPLNDCCGQEVRFIGDDDLMRERMNAV